MTETQRFARRLLWVDAQPSALDWGARHFQACRLAVRFVDNFERALEEIGAWCPHLLLLDYTMPTGAMAYETFVHAQLPLVDPYRTPGPLADNPWRHTAIPILLVSGGPPATIPGFVAPHLHRAAHFVPKPFEPSHLLPLVEARRVHAASRPRAYAPIPIPPGRRPHAPTRSRCAAGAGRSSPPFLGAEPVPEQPEGRSCAWGCLQPKPGSGTGVELRKVDIGLHGC